MTELEILQKAIKKAVANGYRWNEPNGVIYYPDEEAWLYKEGHTYFTSLFSVIFSHDFNKAYWGEYWMPRLQTMVMEENPIKYLERFL